MRKILLLLIVSSKLCYGDTVSIPFRYNQYDALGQVIQETNNVGEKITYSYNHNRLTSKNYSSLSNNSVTYTYGTPSDTNKASIGRITYISDGSGYQRLYYDKMGNVMKNIRTLALPNDNKSYTFEMLFRYDSWGRMKEITYPDGEKVYYKYNAGGELRRVSGEKGDTLYKYIDSIHYNAYGGRTGMWYGNGTKTLYGYDNLHRMTSLQSYAKVSNVLTPMQNITYTYDKVSNITNVSNTAGTINSLGKTSSMVYGYDNGNRLLSATMTYGNQTTGYNISYSPSGRMATKYHGATTALQSKNAHFGYCNGDRPHTVRRIFDLTDGINVLHDMQWDMKGNLLTHAIYDYGDPTYAQTERHLYWTEDNRLHTAVDNNYYSYYAYDHTGERTLKLTGKNTFMDVNGETQASASLNNVTLYVGPYLVATNQGYTKHYYNGTERICAKLGNGGLGNNLTSKNNYSTVADGLFSQCQTAMKGQSMKDEDQICITSLSGEWEQEMKLEDYKGKFTPIQPSLLSKISADVTTFGNTLASYKSSKSAKETNIYFYHSDHLGSASWITNGSGTPVQHLQYMPYGEPFVNERISSYNERFTFTGKERDSETGFCYFGARYYDSDILTGWLSVDPLADKYPNISPYAYCAWNPVKLVDPDGEEIHLTFSTCVKGINTSRELKRIIDGGLGGQFEAIYTKNSNGSYKLSLRATKGGGDITKLTEQQSDFYTELSKIINGEKIAQVDVVYGSRDVVIGSYTNNAIDVADMDQFDNLGEGSCTKQGKLIHELVEQYYKANNGIDKGSDKNYNEAHCYNGIPSENKINGSYRKDFSPIRSKYTQSYTDKKGRVTNYTYSSKDPILKVSKSIKN